MPEIGATLREARMRARIDISEIEAETKIRAKYLRALENEEWGLLPGPAYVRSFLRTYAEALDLDAKLLLEEYKLRHERPSDHDLMPIGTSRGRGRGRGGRGGPMRPQREPRRLPVGFFVGLIILLLVAALYFLGKNNGGGDTASTTGTTKTGRTTTTTVPARTTTTKAATSGSGSSSKKTKAAAGSSKLVRLQVIATGPGPVFACLVDASGQARIPGAVLNEGTSNGPYRSRSFRLRLGNGNARVRVNGKLRDVADESPVAYKISKGKFTKVSVSSVPSCA
jgi:cytoskeleton protein RodZ